MARRSLTPNQWRALPRPERIEMLAFEHLRDERRAAMLRTMKDDMPTEIGTLAQILILLQGE